MLCSRCADAVQHLLPAEDRHGCVPRVLRPVRQGASVGVSATACGLPARLTDCLVDRQERDICAKCCQGKEIVARCVYQRVKASANDLCLTLHLSCCLRSNSEGELAAERQKKAQEFEATLATMSERERRAFLRKVEKEKTAGRGEGEGGEDGFESFDEDEGMDGADEL